MEKKPRKVLIIEDDKAIAATIKHFLDKNNFRTFIASDGREGIELATEVIPDLIVSDIMMPEVDGYQVKEELEANEETANIPFIYISALARITDIRKGMNQGADDYLTKPFKMDELLEAIDTRLKRHQKFKKDNVVVSNKINEDGRILASINNHPQFIKVADIKYIKADGEYSTLFLLKEGKKLVRKLMKEWDELLPANKFIRIHRSIIINLDFVEKIEKWYKRSYIIYMKDEKETLPISQRYYSKLKGSMGI